MSTVPPQLKDLLKPAIDQLLGLLEPTFGPGSLAKFKAAAGKAQPGAQGAQGAQSDPPAAETAPQTNPDPIPKESQTNPESGSQPQSVPPELIAAMLQAQLEGHPAAADQIAELGSDPEALAEFLADHAAGTQGMMSTRAFAALAHVRTFGAYSGTWVEEKHPRKAGQFAKKGEAATSPTDPPIDDDDTDSDTDVWTDEKDLHAKATSRASKIIASLKSIPAAIFAKAKAKVSAVYEKLTARYGKNVARMAVAAGLLGLAIPLPGASFAMAAPVLAVAELHQRLWSGKGSDGEPIITEAPPDSGPITSTARKAGRWFVRQIFGDRVQLFGAMADDPIAAGLAVRAADTGRLLMLKRMESEHDPASDSWEFPGGHLEEGESPEAAALREWSEETGGSLPGGAKRSGSWASNNGVYSGHVFEVPDEDSAGVVGGVGDRKEKLAWIDPERLLGHPQVREELAADLERILPLLTGDVRNFSAFASLAQFPKGTVESPYRDAEVISDFLSADAPLLHIEGRFHIPRSVLGHVIRVIHNPQILKAVVGSIPVNVMNLFRAKQFSSEGFLNKESVLKDLFSGDGVADLSVPLDGNIAHGVTFLLGSIARESAKFAGAVRALPNHFTANFTGVSNGAHSNTLSDESCRHNKFPRWFSWFADPSPRSPSRATDSDTGRHAYGEQARRLLAWQGREDRGEEHPKTTKQALIEHKAAQEPKREEARQAYQAALKDPGSVRPEQLTQLADHLHTLTRDEVRANLRTLEKATGGRLKHDLVDALLSHVRESAIAHHEAKLDPMKMDLDQDEATRNIQALEETRPGAKKMPQQQTADEKTTHADRMKQRQDAERGGVAVDKNSIANHPADRMPSVALTDHLNRKEGGDGELPSGSGDGNGPGGGDSDGKRDVPREEGVPPKADGEGNSEPPSERVGGDAEGHGSDDGTGAESLKPAAEQGGVPDAVKDEPSPKEPEGEKPDESNLPPVKVLKARKQRKPDSTDSLHSWVKHYGGIDPKDATFLKYFDSVNHARENKIPLGVFKKGGEGLDVIAKQMLNSGHLDAKDEVEAEQVLLDGLASGAYSFHQDTSKDADQALADYWKAEEEAHNARANESEIDSAVRSGEEDARHEAGAGESDEDQGHDEGDGGRAPVGEQDAGDDSFDFGDLAPESKPDEATPAAEEPQDDPAKSSPELHNAREMARENGNAPAGEPANQLEPHADPFTHATTNHAPAIKALKPGELGWVGGHQVRALPDGSFQVETGKAYKTGTAEEISGHLNDAWRHAAIEKPAATLAMERAKANPAPEGDWFGGGKQAEDVKRRRAAVPEGARGVSLEPNTRGRLGNVGRDENGATHLHLDGGTEHKATDFEPLASQHSWRTPEVEKPAVAKQEQPDLFDPKAAPAEPAAAPDESAPPIDEAQAAARKWKKNDDGTYTSPNGTIWKKANAGGEVSPITGEPFAGGRLMPIHGLHQKVEKKPAEQEGGGGDVKPNENAKEKEKNREQGRIDPMTPEQIEEEKQRREDVAKWREVGSGVLGRLKWLGDHPNWKALQSHVLPSDRWKPFAEEHGEEKLKRIADELRKDRHAAIDADEADKAARGEPASSQENVDWDKNQPEMQAESDKSMFPRMMGSQKKLPSGLLARQHIQHALHSVKTPSDLHALEMRLRGIVNEPAASPQPTPPSASPAASPPPEAKPANEAEPAEPAANPDAVAGGVKAEPAEPKTTVTAMGDLVVHIGKNDPMGKMLTTKYRATYSKQKDGWVVHEAYKGKALESIKSGEAAGKLATSRSSVKLGDISKMTNVEDAPALKPGSEPASIVLEVDEHGKPRGIVDGMHRLAGMVRWAKENGVDPNALPIDVVTTNDQSLIADAAEPGPKQAAALDKIYRKAGTHKPTPQSSPPADKSGPQAAPKAAAPKLSPSEVSADLKDVLHKIRGLDVKPGEVDDELAKLDSLSAPELLQVAKSLNNPAAGINASFGLNEKSPKSKIVKQLKEMINRAYKTVVSGIDTIERKTPEERLAEHRRQIGYLPPLKRPPRDTRPPGHRDTADQEYFSAMSGEFDENKHPRADDGKFGEGGGSAETTQEPTKPPERNSLIQPRTEEEIAAVQKIKDEGKQMFSDLVSEATHLTPETKKHYEDTIHKCVDFMTAPMVKRLAKTVGGATFYKTTEELTETLMPGKTKEKNPLTGAKHLMGGAWQWQSTDRVGTLHLNGGGDTGDEYQGDTRGVYAHELGHAIDFAGTHSKTPEWDDAWREEIYTKDAPLSRYAMRNQSEGLAEYFRLMNTQPKVARTDFPKCWAAFKKWGYV